MPPVPKPPTAKSGPNRTLIIAVVAGVLAAAALIVGSIALSGGDDNSATPTTTAEETTTAGETTAGATTETTPAVETGAAILAGVPQNGTVLGNASAKVRLLQYEDLQCPICQAYTADVFPTIVAEYVKTGKVKVDFRGIAFIGEDSEKALRIALAAGRQNKLWNVVELFYEKQGSENSGWVTSAKIDEILGKVPGLDAAKVKRDAASAAVTAQIATIQDEATRRKVPGTPWFFIGIGLNEPYAIQPGALTPEAFRPALDDALAR